MAFYKLFFFFAVAFFACVAIFIGGVTLLTSLQNGQISITYASGGQAMAETAVRTVDGARYWRLVGLLGALPTAIGAAVLWYSVRQMKFEKTD